MLLGMTMDNDAKWFWFMAPFFSGWWLRVQVLWPSHSPMKTKMSLHLSHWPKTRFGFRPISPSITGGFDGSFPVDGTAGNSILRIKPITKRGDPI
jgi:hypothetical protein